MMRNIEVMIDGTSKDNDEANDSVATAAFSITMAKTTTTATTATVSSAAMTDT